jgi:hypothetical protein
MGSAAVGCAEVLLLRRQALPRVSEKRPVRTSLGGPCRNGGKQDDDPGRQGHREAEGEAGRSTLAVAHRWLR